MTLTPLDTLGICPRCHRLARFTWSALGPAPDALQTGLGLVLIASCHSCDRPHYWTTGEAGDDGAPLTTRFVTTAIQLPEPVRMALAPVDMNIALGLPTLPADTPAPILAHYQQAQRLLAQHPGSACALIRLATHDLLQLDDHGEDLDTLADAVQQHLGHSPRILRLMGLLDGTRRTTADLLRHGSVLEARLMGTMLGTLVDAMHGRPAHLERAWQVGEPRDVSPSLDPVALA